MNIGSGTKVSDWTTMVVDSSCNQMDYMIKHFDYFLPGLSTKHLVIAILQLETKVNRYQKIFLSFLIPWKN